MSKQKIVYILEKQDLETQKLILSMIIGMTNAGYDSWVITGLTTKDIELGLDIRNIEIIEIKEMRKREPFIIELKAIYKVYCQLKKFSPDIVHTYAKRGEFVGRFSALLACVSKRVHTYI